MAGPSPVDPRVLECGLAVTTCGRGDATGRPGPGSLEAELCLCGVEVGREARRAPRGVGCRVERG